MYQGRHVGDSRPHVRPARGADADAETTGRDAESTESEDEASAPSPSADSHAIGNHLHGARGTHTVFYPTGGNDLRNGYEEGCGAATGPGRSPPRGKLSSCP